MRIEEAFNRGRPVISFEFFPPRSDEAAAALRRTVAELAPLEPDYVSVTYGAGGSTRERTIDVVTEIRREPGIESMAHLTCVGHSADEIAVILDRLAVAGIENVLALRGDPPRGQTEFVQPEGGFAHGSDLAAFIRSRWNFCLGGATYPEGHLESPDPEQDVRYALVKQQAGMSFLNTQLFFDDADYFRFVERCRAGGVTIPIVPGLLPITAATQLAPTGFIARCGARVPAALRERIEAVADDEEAVTEAGIAWTTEQCMELLRGGAPGIHFYTMNRSRATREVYRRLRDVLVASGR